MATDPYKIHRLALLPFVYGDPQQAFAKIKAAAPVEDEFLAFILQQSLGPLWAGFVERATLALFSPAFKQSLQDAKLKAAANYLRQKHALRKITTTFESAAMPYAVYKGGHIREIIYSSPSLRPACDLDILVAREDKVRAIKELLSTGFSFHPDTLNISHEASLSDGYTNIDLHWDILRPGRIRIGITEEFLATREKFSSHWGLSHEATLFIMLVHPVFAKYGTAPQASLVRMVDLARWIQTFQIDWEKLLDWLKRGGVQTAAWITSEWLLMLTGITMPEPFMQRIKPSPLRSLYLRKWLNSNLSSRLHRYPTLVQAGLTLPAHDSLADAWHAIVSLLKAKQTAAADTKKLISLCSE